MLRRLEQTAQTNIVQVKLDSQFIWRLVKGAQGVVAVDSVGRLVLRFAPTNTSRESFEKVPKTEIHRSMKLLSAIFERKFRIISAMCKHSAVFELMALGRMAATNINTFEENRR
jgi:hypothetical protein